MGIEDGVKTVCGGRGRLRVVHTLSRSTWLGLWDGGTGLAAPEVGTDVLFNAA